MEKDKLRVIIIDDDGLTTRNNIFRRYYQCEADRLGLKLIIQFHTSFPYLSELILADIISWDNDLGVEGETIRHLRRLQYIADNEDFTNSLKDKIHIIHSMNNVASHALFELFTHDIGAKAYLIPFTHMKDLVEQLDHKQYKPATIYINVDVGGNDVQGNQI